MSMKGRVMFFRVMEFNSDSIAPTPIWKGTLEYFITNCPSALLLGRDLAFEFSLNGDNWIAIPNPRLEDDGRVHDVLVEYLLPTEGSSPIAIDNFVYGEPSEVLDDYGYRLELHDPLAMGRCLGLRCVRNAITDDGFCRFHDRVFSLIGDDEVPSIRCGTSILIIT